MENHLTIDPVRSPARLPSAGPVPYPARITRRIQETHDSFTVELEPPSHHALEFRPGQFNMLFAPPMGEVPISISGPAGGQWIHTIRVVGPTTRALSHFKLGDFVGVRGPFGSGWPIEELRGRDVFVLAGGLGMAPLRPVVYHLLNERDTFRQVVLLYGARTPQDRLFSKEFDKWSSRSDMVVKCTVDMATDGWKGHVGVITSLIAGLTLDPLDAAALICGPEAMMHFSVRELHRRGIASDRMYVSMERNMKCAVGLCGHCQYGGSFVCRDGPVYRFDRIEPFFAVREF